MVVVSISLPVHCFEEIDNHVMQAPGGNCIETDPDKSEDLLASQAQLEKDISVQNYELEHGDGDLGQRGHFPQTTARRSDRCMLCYCLVFGCGGAVCNMMGQLVRCMTFNYCCEGCQLE